MSLHDKHSAWWTIPEAQRDRPGVEENTGRAARAAHMLANMQAAAATEPRREPWCKRKKSRVIRAAALTLLSGYSVHSGRRLAVRGKRQILHEMFF